MPGPTKFLGDEHIPRAVARVLRQQGVDMLTVAEAGTRGLADEDQFAFAQAQGRAIVTYDRDYLRLAALSPDHAGVVYSARRLSIGEIVRALMLVHQVYDADSMVGRVEYL